MYSDDDSSWGEFFTWQQILALKGWVDALVEDMAHRKAEAEREKGVKPNPNTPYWWIKGPLWWRRWRVTWRKRRGLSWGPGAF